VSDPVVELRGVGKRYGTGVEALRDVTAGFSRGKLTTLLGPSGCGKTTLLKIVAGLIQPTSGEVRVDGRRVEGPGPERAFVFQDFALLPWATVLRNVAFGLELRGTPREAREATARNWIREVGLAGFEQSYPHQLSGGMRQRVGLARALVMEPDVLLLDEPFGALDAQTRLVLQEQLAALVERSGTTAILVTHSIEEAILLADTILVMTARPGRIAAEIAVDLPRPRSHGTAKEPAYGALFERIYGLLRDEVMRAMVGERADA